MTYDNTQNNPNQPSNPAKTVTLGEATTSEMMLTYFYYMDYKAGDETILQDSSLLKASIKYPFVSNPILLSPNPVSNEIFIEGMTDFKDAKLQIIDQLGRTVLEKTLTSDILDTRNLNRLKINVDGLNSGVYSLRVTTDTGKVYSNKFIKD